jgi:hypothetical protein
MLKSFLKVAAVSLVSSAFCYSTAASALDLSFLQEGFDEGAFVTGTFSGEDLDNNGQLSSFRGEVTDFMMSFSGNSLVDRFSLNFDNLFGLVYDLDGGPLGDGFMLDVEGIGAFSEFQYLAGPGPLACVEGITICGVVSQDSDGEFSTTLELVQVEAVQVEAVPEPLTILGTVTVMGFIGFNKKRQKFCNR